MTSNEPVKLFVSYSHNDDQFREDLNVHLSPLVREGSARVWYDRKIIPGTDWEKEISGALEQAEVHLLLVSPDFFASDYCYGKEMSAALEMHNRQKAIVVPIVIRPVDWTHSKLARLQALPKDAIPITLSENRDAAWLSVIAGIRTVCGRVVEGRGRGVSASTLTSFPISQLMGQVIDDVESLFNRDDPAAVTGIPTGLHDFDTAADGLHTGELTVLASAPGMDREGLLVTIASHVTASIRIPVAFVCTQFDPKYIASRFITTASHLSVGRFRRGTMSDDDWDRLTVGLGMTHEAPLEVLAAPGAKVGEVLEQLTELAQRYGALPLIVIDSLAHFAEDKTVVIRRLHEFVNQSQKAILAGVGLERDPGERADKRPLVSDLGKWAALDEDMDQLLLLYFDQVYYPETPDRDVAELIIARSRHRALGTVRLFHIADQQRFENLPEGTR